MDYAKVRQQFGRTIATFQAVKHHCANMLVAASPGRRGGRPRAASEDEGQFQLAAAVAATLAFPAYARNAELNIQVHGGIGFTWEHDAHLHLRRALVIQALFGGDAPARDIFERTAAGATRENSLDLPPEAEELRTRIHADAAAIAQLDKEAQRDKLIETGYVMPHWPKPWGRAADAVEQLVIEEEFRAAGIKRPDYSITGWVILTLIQHGTDWQIERFVEKALRQEEIWCQLFSEPEAGSDAASVKTRATRVDGGWKINGQKVWTSGAQYCARGLATVRTDPEAPKHAGITTVIIDMKGPGVEVRPLRQITGGSEFNEVFFNDVFVPDEDVVGRPTRVDGRPRHAGQRAGQHRRQRIVLRGPGVHPGAARPAVGSLGRGADSDRVLPRRRPRAAAAEPAPRRAQRRGSGPGSGRQHHQAEAGRTHGGRRRDLGGAGGPGGRADGRARRGGGPAGHGARGMAIAGGTSEVTRNQIAERILGMPRDPLIN